MAIAALGSPSHQTRRLSCRNFFLKHLTNNNTQTTAQEMAVYSRGPLLLYFCTAFKATFLRHGEGQPSNLSMGRTWDPILSCTSCLGLSIEKSFPSGNFIVSRRYRRTQPRRRALSTVKYTFTDAGLTTIHQGTLRQLIRVLLRLYSKCIGQNCVSSDWSSIIFLLRLRNIGNFVYWFLH